jgi:hypothetical protein
MGERIADAATPDSRMGEVGDLRGPLDPDAALRQLTDAPLFERRVVRLVQEVLDTLDGMLDAPIEDRLTVVADRAAECVGAASSSVTRVRDGVLRPRVAEAAEGSAFRVTLDTGDPVEQAALRAAGFTSTMVAGGYDPDAHRWLVELFGDESTHETTSFAAILFSLTQAALGFPRAVAPHRSAS